jgi:two-component system chemotaxis response regulator CheB
VAIVEDGELVSLHKPSVAVLFNSVASEVKANAIGVMLTGMGSDGAQAMRTMRDAGSYNLVQDAASCIVFGMPREAIARGAADAVLPLQQIAPALVARLQARTVRLPT